MGANPLFCGDLVGGRPIVTIPFVEPWPGDDDCLPGSVDSHQVDAEERRALNILAGASQRGLAVSTLLAHGISDDTRARLVRLGLVYEQSRTLLSGDRKIALAWIKITAEGRSLAAEAIHRFGRGCVS